MTTPSAKGMPIGLQMRARKRFCLIFRMMVRLRAIVVETLFGSPHMSTTSVESALKISNDFSAIGFDDIMIRTSIKSFADVEPDLWKP